MRVYFPNLNGLRLIAACSVVVSHVEMVKMVFGENHIWNTRTIHLLGHLGVIMFFALSGFLITYLLLVENKVKRRVSVKNFYVRRVLRIWPLYFFLVALGLFALPHISMLDIPNSVSLEGKERLNMVLLYLLILPNVAVKMYPAVAYIGHTWSIGVEEQFYLIWPWLVKLSKNILTALTAVIVIYLAILFGAEYYASVHPESRGAHVFLQVWLTSSIDCMAIGGIFAWIYFHKKEKTLNLLYHPAVNYGSIILTLLMIFIGIRFPVLHHEIYAVLFSIIILNFSTNPKHAIILEQKHIHYLGKISYGVYMYHVLCIVLSYKLVLFLLGHHNNFLLYLFSFILTFIISIISYEMMEVRFIHLKSKFSAVISGDLAKKKMKE